MEIDASHNQAELDRIEFLIARNDFIDAFADLEVAVCRVLRSTGQNPKSEPFGQRVKTFREAEKTHLIAKANYGARNQIADEIFAILPVRADIVHSRMNTHRIDGQLAAVLTNVQDAGAEFPTARILTLAQFKQLVSRITQFTQRIAALGKINPASLPQPPSPGAAGDP
ncbi:MAG: hypothetical protein KGM18_07310 [Sphingomonadales bacterium]|nr:hypothetical protein [Sphingomonadales bacterium]